MRAERLRRPGWLAICTIVVGLSWAGPSSAQEEIVLPTDDATIMIGKDRFGLKCSGFCHGSGGRGGRAPCLVCGSFKRGGTNAEIIKNITEGVKNTPMGAFGETYTRDEIIAIVAYLRSEQKKKEAGDN